MIHGILLRKGHPLYLGLMSPWMTLQTLAERRLAAKAKMKEEAEEIHPFLVVSDQGGITG